MAAALHRTALLGPCIAAALLAGCVSDNAASLPAPPVASQALGERSVGLGGTLSTRDGMQIYGFAIASNGRDGLLATPEHIEAFNANTGRVTGSFPKTTPAGTTYSLDGIFTGNVALVTRYVVPNGKIYAKRFYSVIRPSSAGTFTGRWTPPIKDVNVYQAGPNFTSASTALFAIELRRQDRPVLIVSNVEKNTFGAVVHLDPSSFSLGDQPQLAQDTVTNQAVFATSPDGGAVGGAAPINVLADMTTGHLTQFEGLNNGPYGAGFVNGLAVDSATGIAVTTTELNAQVEFYDLATETGTAVQLPCTGPASQENSGSGIATDAVNKLVLVTDPVYCDGSQGSAIVVYDESGNLVESITGFSFGPGASPPIVVPSKRMGWAYGPNPNQLQQFFY